MDIIHISGNTYYFNTPVSIGAIIEDNSAILIDTGLDENAVRKVLNWLKEKDIKLKYVINTHSHSDHIGGNAFVEARTKTTFYASEIEAAFIRNPELLPDFIYGASSISELKSKFYYSAPTENVRNIKELKEKFRIVELPGHTFQMIGIITEDNVFFVADSVFSKQILGKHSLIFHIDTARFLSTLEFLAQQNADFHLLSHGGVLKKIDAELEENKKQINILLSIIEDHKPDNLENLISKIMEENDISTIDQYFLNRVPVMAAIKYLKELNRINVIIEEGKLTVK
ncbi:MAG: MBL fold metallo-hydrolase [Thermoplasmata archaeon]